MRENERCHIKRERKESGLRTRGTLRRNEDNLSETREPIFFKCRIKKHMDRVVI